MVFSIANRMQERLATVPVALGQGGSYKRLTSDAAAQGARVYDATWTAAGGVVQGRMMTQGYNPAAGAQVKTEIAKLTVSSALVFNLGDLWQDSAGLVWELDGAGDSGVGSTTYQIKRDIAMIGGPDRQAGA